ncbi:MAG TPA: phosphatase PAP2 family protein [Thermoanaerobaculia bacterium]|nr:phosphatase PAP2 family protein [Thermoanaerobaculia bacterium]
MTSSPTAASLDRPAWSLALESLKRPYPLTVPVVVSMGALVLLVPLYIVIGEMMPGRRLHAPGTALDEMVLLQPPWAIVYGCLYLFLILLPLLVVRQEELIRRTLWTYLTVWLTAYVCFFLYPTAAPRPASVVGPGFAVWGLRFLYGADPPFNCFPSLHVAHSCVSAMACSRVNRGVGVAAGIGAALVGVSTLFTKQHYVVDVVAGVVLAWLGYLLFLRGYPAVAIPPLDRRAAPALAVGVLGIVALVAACFWVAYELGVVA